MLHIKNMKLLIFTLVLIAITFSGCLEENIEPVEITFNNMLDILNYAETNGDFINSPENPALIDVDEVQAALGSYLILDIRNQSDFAKGHIPGALNIIADQIINLLDTMKTLDFQKVVIVSSSGQKAAYVTSLLRIIGYDNIYSLDYGMGYWNEIFADVWISSKTNSKYFNTYYLLEWPNKEELTIKYDTPNPFLDDEAKTIDKKLKRRVEMLIKNFENNSVITIEKFDDMFNPIPYYFGYGEHTFIICYDHELKRGANPREPLLYNAHNIYPTPVFNSAGGAILYYKTRKSRTVRPLGAYLYNGQKPEYDFSSDRLLFTLPADKQIIIYSYNGQRSAYITAYLNLLGYDAKFVKFGAHSMMSKYFISWEIHGAVDKGNLDTVYYPSEFSKYDFYEENIRNYPYEVGTE